jgi:NAD(P)-dependent dehydrogenase (short-subunit alcohol dehydrogenase family)
VTSIPALFDLTGRVAILTGAAGLLGQRYAMALAEAGAQLVLADLDGPKCQRLAADVTRTSGRKAVAIAADVSQAEGAQAVADQARASLGGTDILINNVMAKPPGYYAPLEQYSLDAWEKTFAGNVTSILLLTQRVAPQMIGRGGGVIVNVASTYGLVAPDQRIYEGIANPYHQGAFSSPVSYAASKSAVLNLTRYLAGYYGAQKIRVNTLTPGGVDDGQEPTFVRRYAERTMIGRMAKPDDYLGAMLFLVSDASSYMTGANLVVDGGWTAW